MSIKLTTKPHTISIIRCNHELNQELYKKIYKFISAPSLKGLYDLASFLNMRIFIKYTENKIYFIKKSKSKFDSLLKNIEDADIVFSYK